MLAFSRTSDILSALAGTASERLSVREILGILRGRAFALLIVVLGLPNCLPMPPPIPLVCGLLLAFVAAQIALGRPSPWMPRRILDRSVAKQDVERAIQRALPLVLRLERWSRPRVSLFDSPVAMRLIGVVLLVLSFGLLLAAPFIGQIPVGLGVCLLGLGLVERDGVLVFVGVAVGSIGILLSLGFVYAVVAGIRSFF